jgi:hypothetical protein
MLDWVNDPGGNEGRSLGGVVADIGDLVSTGDLAAAMAGIDCLRSVFVTRGDGTVGLLLVISWMLATVAER